MTYLVHEEYKLGYDKYGYGGPYVDIEGHAYEARESMDMYGRRFWVPVNKRFSRTQRLSSDTINHLCDKYDLLSEERLKLTQGLVKDIFDIYRPRIIDIRRKK